MFPTDLIWYHLTWNPFTSLEETINVALDKIYHRKEIETSISKNGMFNLLLLCTKNVHFCFGGDIYQQNNDVAMGSPLGYFYGWIGDKNNTNSYG